MGWNPPLHRKAWHRLKGWHWATFDRDPPPARVTLERITTYQVEHYSYIAPLGENIPISVKPLPLDDSVPREDKIKWTVKRLQNHRSGGPSGMRSDHLKLWLASAKRKEREKEVAKRSTQWRIR